MYPRIVRQIAPMGETLPSSTVEAVSGCCQFIWEFMGYQISCRLLATEAPASRRPTLAMPTKSSKSNAPSGPRRQTSTRFVPQCDRCPYTAATPPEPARCRRLADSSPRSQPTCAPPPKRCRSTYAKIPSCSSLPDGSEYSPAVPENFRSSSTKKSRGTDSVPAARLQCHTSSPPKIRYQPCTA